MAENEIIVEISARIERVEKALEKLEEKAKESGEKTGDRFSKAFKVGLAAAAAGIAAFGVVLSKGISEAIAGENALNELNNALARTGQYSKEASLDMQEFAAGLQKTSVFAAGAIISNAALIQSLGKLSTEGLKEATQAAADLSAALGVDLRTASMMVGKAAAGEIGSFSRYGLVIREGATNAETFANALAAINKQFGGAAAAQVNTYGGRMEQLKNTISDLLEELGKAIIKSPAVVAGIKFIAGQVEKLTLAVTQWRESGGFERMLTTGVDVARFFVSVLGPIFEAMYNRIVAVGQSIGILGSALVELVSRNFRTAAGLVKEGFVTLFDFRTMFQFGGTDAALGFIDGFKTSIQNAPPITSEIKKKVQAEVDTFEGISWEGFKNSFVMTVEQMRDAAKQLMTTLRQTIINGVGGAFQAMGAALVKGENAFAAFGKAVLGMFGDLAIQLGQFYLALAFANLISFNYAAAAGNFAAAALLFALGGALKALAGGGGGGASASASAGGSSAAAPAAETTLSSNLEADKREEPKTEVNVNIAGNVLDRRETGIEIADIINETFSTNGIVIARGATV